jgi:hypothetical protein
MIEAEIKGQGQLILFRRRTQLILVSYSAKWIREIGPNLAMMKSKLVYFWSQWRAPNCECRYRCCVVLWDDINGEDP